MLGINNLHFIFGDVFGDRQITIEGRIAVLFRDRSVRVDATVADKEFLEPIAPAKTAKGRRVAMIEMLMADENVVKYRFGVLQILTEQIRVEGNIDIAEADIEIPTTPPSK